MKRWEENRRKQLYANKIQAAKPTLNTQPGKKSGQRQSTTNVSSSKGFNHTNTSVSTKVAGVALAVSEEIYGERQGEIKISDLPIFQLLKAFKLQQYALKLAELGYGEELYKLALLNDKQRQDLVVQLKVLPGHKAKLVSLFDVIDEVRLSILMVQLYPKKIVAEQLKQFTPGGSQLSTDKKPKRITSAMKSKQGIHTTTASKTLLQQYEQLDTITKQAFNETFLVNLESVKYNMGQLMSQHVNREEAKMVINNIFPPTSYLGFGNKVLDQQLKTDDAYNREIESLLKKYTVNSAYKNFNSKEALDKRTTAQQASDLKVEMAQAMRDVEQINKHLEQFVKPQSVQNQLRAASKQGDQRPNTKQSTYEVFTDDFDKSRFTTTSKKNPIQVEQDDEMPSSSDISITESQIDEALNILNDPLALSLAVKEQYEQALKVVAQNQVKPVQPVASRPGTQDKKKTEQPQPPPNEEASFINPLAAGDDSKLNISTKFYNKQNVFSEPEENKKARPLSPLIEKEERDRLWNCGQSLNSKQVTSALGYLDLKQICYCLANALMKHIEFSKGFMFLDELQDHLKNQNMYGGDTERESMPLEFTYNIKDNLKIDLERAKQKKLEKEAQSKKEFEDLKKKMQAEQEKKQISQQQKIQEVSVLDSSPAKVQEDQDEIEDETVNQDESQDIDEEVKDEVEETDYIQDYYEDVSNTPKQGKQEPLEVDDDIDFDYSQTHLEDFLKSQNNNTLFKNSNVQSSQLLNTFLSSYSKMKSNTFRDSQNPQLATKNITSKQQMNPIDEKLEQSESERSESRTLKMRDSESEDDDGFGRSGEHIDLAKVEVKSTNSPQKKQKPILSQQEVEAAKKKQQAEDNKLKANEIKIDVKTKQGFQDLLRFQMRIYDQNYDFERDHLVGGESMYLGAPTLEEVYYYCKYVIISGRMEKEIPILCLVYIERFLTKTGVLMNHANWKRLTLISLTLASKIWDDDSLENVHFPQVMPDVTLKEIASLEKVFLSLIDFDLIIKGAEYAKYYFILKHFAEKFNSTLPMGPLTIEQMSDLQNNTVKAESDLRERYNVKLSLKKTM